MGQRGLTSSRLFKTVSKTVALLAALVGIVQLVILNFSGAILPITLLQVTAIIIGFLATISAIDLYREKIKLVK